MTIYSRKFPDCKDSWAKTEAAPRGCGSAQNGQNTALTPPCGLAQTQTHHQQIKPSEAPHKPPSFKQGEMQ